MIISNMFSYRKRWLGIMIPIMCLSLFQASAQQLHEISGYVVDSETGEPVPYASVGVPEQQTGITANINGFFKLILSENNPLHHFQIGSIGYERKTIAFGDINWNDQQRFQLIPKPMVLGEVVVEGKKETLDELLKSASKNRRNNLRSAPYLMHGLYREVLKVENEYKGLTEAQGILYIDGYNPNYKNNQNNIMTYDLAQWKQIRRSDYPASDAQYLRIGKLLKAKDYYLHEGPLDRSNLKKFDFFVIDSSQYEDQPVMIIDFKPKPEFLTEIPYHGRMYIKEDDQALLALEVEASGPEPFLKEHAHVKRLNSRFEISFLKFNGQYYLKHTSFSQHSRRGEESIENFSEIVGGSFTDQRATFLNEAQRAVLYGEMLNPLIIYEPTFWTNFDYAQSQVFQEMSRDSDNLEKQFQENDDRRIVPLPEGFQNYEQMVNERTLLDFFIRY